MQKWLLGYNHTWIYVVNYAGELATYRLYITFVEAKVGLKTGDTGKGMRFIGVLGEILSWYFPKPESDVVVAKRRAMACIRYGRS